METESAWLFSTDAVLFWEKSPYADLQGRSTYPIGEERPGQSSLQICVDLGNSTGIFTLHVGYN
jgi:hypothetical protein